MTQTYASERRLPYAYTPEERGWTETRVETLKTLWKDGLSCSQIAKHLGGVSCNAVIGKVHRLKLIDNKNRKPARDAVQAVRMKIRRKAEATTPRINPTPPPKLPVDLAAIRALAPIDPTLGIDRLSTFTCRFPIGHPSDPGFAFCGRTCDAIATYCVEHHKLAYTRIDARREAGLARLATFLTTGVLRSRAA